MTSIPKKNDVLELGQLRGRKALHDLSCGVWVVEENDGVVEIEPASADVFAVVAYCPMAFEVGVGALHDVSCFSAGVANIACGCYAYNFHGE